MAVQIMILVAAVLFTWVCMTALAERLGHDQAWLIGLFSLVPIIGFFVFLYLCFGEAPNQRRIAELEHKLECFEGEEIDLTKCPACGASVTEADTRCPSCKLSFEL